MTEEQQSEKGMTGEGTQSPETETATGERQSPGEKVPTVELQDLTTEMPMGKLQSSETETTTEERQGPQSSGGEKTMEERLLAQEEELAGLREELSKLRLLPRAVGSTPGGQSVTKAELSTMSYRERAAFREENPGLYRALRD